MDRLRGLVVSPRSCGDTRGGGASVLLLREYILGAGILEPRLAPRGAVGMAGREVGGPGEALGGERWLDPDRWERREGGREGEEGGRGVGRKGGRGEGGREEGKEGGMEG